MKVVKYEDVRKKLMDMRQALIKESKAEIGKLVEKYEGASDEGDLAEVTTSDTMQAANLTRHRARLKAINEALLSIDEGTYGVCVDCGEDIPVARLSAMPFALRCVDCQETHEKTQSDQEDSAAGSAHSSEG